jgi:ubiquinone/menaquinone biosynthesis C-methylase UbiE
MRVKGWRLPRSWGIERSDYPCDRALVVAGIKRVEHHREWRAKMGNEQTFFDFAAEVGLTKHLGGVGATEELIELCHIGEGKYVLDVGCGAGVTPCFIAKRYGCRVVGVDISEGMVERSKERAKREGVADRVEFRVADAQDLPLEDDLFDAVITESVTAFPEDKQGAVNEYARVTKPGGYVGLNESTWLKAPPPPELVAWAAQDLGANVGPLTSGGWCRGMLGVFCRMLALYAKSPAYRRFVKEVREDGVAPDNLDEYFGYGVYVGRK